MGVGARRRPAAPRGRAFVTLTVLSQHPPFAEEILLAHGAQSVTLVDGADDPVLEPAPGATPLWPTTRAIGLFPAGHALAPAIAALRATLPDGARAIVTTARLADRDWVRLWLRDWRPLRFGRLWVSPRAKIRAIRGNRDAVIVALDPGLAFGTGTHPSTALCLDWLAHAELDGKTVLDYGCGSGVLAIAALKLGAARATAIDIDPQALRATRANARANGVASRLTCRLARAYVPRRHDVVLANILAGPLVALARRLVASLASDGRLVLAGLLPAQAAAVRAAYRDACAFGPTIVRDGWVRLAARKRVSARPARRARGNTKRARAAR